MTVLNRLPMAPVRAYTTPGAIDPGALFVLLEPSSSYTAAAPMAMTLANDSGPRLLIIKCMGPGVATVTGNFDGLANTTRRFDSPNGAESLWLAQDPAAARWLVLAQFDPGLQYQDCPAATALSDSDICLVSQSGSLGKATLSTLKAYIGAGSSGATATAYTTGLSAGSGPTNSPVTVTFTPTAGGWPSALTITPTVTSLTGSFSPTTISPTAGSTAAVTCTFTPTAAATGSINSTTSPSMTNASGAQTYTATASSALALDNVTSMSIRRAVGFVKLKSGATNCCDLVNGAETTTTIGFGSDQSVDTSAINATQSGTTDLGRVTKWYDQSGSSRDLGLGFSSAGGILVYHQAFQTAGANNKPAVQGSAALSYAPSLDADTLGSTSGGIMTVLKGYGLAAGQVISHMAGMVVSMASATTVQATCSGKTATYSTPIGANGSIVEAYVDGSGNLVVAVDGNAGTPVSGAALTSGAEYFTLGGNIGNPPANGVLANLAAAIQWSGAYNSTDASGMRAALKSAYATP